MGISGHTSDGAVIGTMVVGTVLGAFTVIARMFTRTFVNHNAGWDDFFICVACAFSIAHTVTTCKRVYYGMGDHFDTLDDHIRTQAFFWFWVSIWVYYAGLFFVKISILMQYLRIFFLKTFRMACFTLMAIVVIISCWSIFSGIFMCLPLRHFWDKDVPGTCLHKLGVWYSTAAMSAMTDLAIAILPLPLVKTLPIPSRQKALLLVIFGIGFGSCFVSIMRLVWLYPIASTTDVTYESPLSALWSNLELNTGIICCCLPTLRSCFTRIFPRAFSSAAMRQATLENSPVSSRPWTPGSIPTEYSVKEKSASVSCVPVPPLPKIPRTRPKPLDCLSCGSSDHIDSVHMKDLPSPPITALPRVHIPPPQPKRVVSLPDTVARWRDNEKHIQGYTPSRRESTKTLLRAARESMRRSPASSPRADG